MSKQKRDNAYRGFQLEWKKKFAFVEGTVTILSLRKRKAGSLKLIITSADARYCTQNQVKSEKRSSRPQMPNFFAQNQVRSKKRSSHPQIPDFPSKSSEEQRKGRNARGP